MRSTLECSFCFFKKTIGKIIVISPVGINKTGRNIDDDPFIGKRRIHLNPVDIISVYEDNVVRLAKDMSFLLQSIAHYRK